MTNWIIKSTASMALLCVVSSAAMAEEGPTPNRSVESFGAWTVECTRVAKPVASKAKVTTKKDAKKTDILKPVKEEFTKICEAVQTYTNKKTGNEVARLAFGYDGGKTKGKLVAGIRSLVDVSFEKKPAIVVEKDVLFEGMFTRCARIYCYGRFDLDAKKLQKLQDAKKAAFRYPVSNGREIQINISSAGLKDALASLKTK